MNTLLKKFLLGFLGYVAVIVAYNVYVAGSEINVVSTVAGGIGVGLVTMLIKIKGKDDKDKNSESVQKGETESD